MKVTKITIGRLYNLGSYEHVRYELTVEVKDGESAATALVGLEKILAALSPKTSTHSRQDLWRESLRIQELQAALAAMTDENEFRRKHGYFEGTPAEYVSRCAQSHFDNVKERDRWEQCSAKARKMLEDLGGAANWKDAKLDWEDDQYQDDEL